MDRWTMHPMAWVISVQPYLFCWVLAISFFLSLAVVALLSRGKSFAWFAGAFFCGWVCCFGLVSVVSSSFLNVDVFDVETISLGPMSP